MNRRSLLLGMLAGAYAAPVGRPGLSRFVEIAPGFHVTRELMADPAAFQAIAGRQFQLSEIARIFSVPPHMLGGLDGARATFGLSKLDEVAAANVVSADLHLLAGDGVAPPLGLFKREFKA